MSRNKYIDRFTFYLFLMFAVASCKKQVEVNPPVTSINADNVYGTDATASAVLTGLYTRISQTSDYGNRGIPTMSMTAGLSADELRLYTGANADDIACYTNSLSISNMSTTNHWSKIYPYLFIANSAIEGLANSTTLTPAVKQQLQGEAKFMRAFFYFYLVNFYGDVPLVLGTDYTVNAVLPRTPKAQVYQQIITDLKDAQGLLIDGYVDGTVLKSTSARVRPNKWAATALLARTYLYSGDFVNAETQATLVINNSSLYNLVTDLNKVFLANSREAIWQFQPVLSGWNTEDAKLFIISNAPAGLNAVHPVYLSSYLLNAFETGDARKTNWINSYTDPTGTYNYPYKYKSATNGTPVTEYLMVLRLAEQYLIRAEARAQQNNINEAQNDLNMIRARAGLTNTTASDKASLLSAILQERRVEFFSEWGHRWLDLKRTNGIDVVMNVITPQKAANFSLSRQWNTNQQLYPIPFIEIQRDINLVQNQGY